MNDNYNDLIKRLKYELFGSVGYFDIGQFEVESLYILNYCCSHVGFTEDSELNRKIGNDRVDKAVDRIKYDAKKLVTIKIIELGEYSIIEIETKKELFNFYFTEKSYNMRYR